MNWLGFAQLAWLACLGLGVVKRLWVWVWQGQGMLLLIFVRVLVEKMFVRVFVKVLQQLRCRQRLGQHLLPAVALLAAAVVMLVPAAAF